jgi:hypothetical protein
MVEVAGMQGELEKWLRLWPNQRRGMRLKPLLFWEDERLLQ